MKKILCFIFLCVIGVNLTHIDAKEYNFGLSKPRNHERPNPGKEIENLIKNNNGIYIGPDEKKVYFTFDCGYENGYTLNILDTLKKNDVKATFFITGHYLTSSKSIVERMINDGHIIGNHTNKHKNFAKVSLKEVEEDCLSLEKKFEEMFDLPMSNYVRPPAGAFNELSLKKLNEMGFKSVFWSLAYVDWYKDKYNGNNYSLNNVKERIHNGAIILMHTVSKDNMTDLDNIITYLKDEGFEIGTINQII